MKNSTDGLPFDLRDTSALKAIGILSIVLHNFFHQLPDAVKENEFGFRPEHFQQFLASVVTPQQAFQSFFSFLGHFGVQLFIFLSAYGLALKYWTVPSWRTFVTGRIFKIYPTYFLALGLWVLMAAAKNGPADVLKAADDLALTTLAVINVVPGYGLPPIGPWWFLPFIVQFYALWPPIAEMIRRYKGPALATLALACLGATIAFNPTLIQWEINLLETPVGHMPELCLGIACARFGSRIGPVTALAALGVFVLGNLYKLAWPMTFVAALVILLYGYQLTRRVWRDRKLLEKVAEVSMPLFFVNGFLRGPFLDVARRLDAWYTDLLVGLVFALFAIGVAYVLMKVEQRLFRSRPGRKDAGVTSGM